MNSFKDTLAQLLLATLHLEHWQITRLLWRVRSQAVKRVRAGGGARFERVFNG